MQQSIRFKDKKTGRSYDMPWSDPTKAPTPRDFNNFVNEKELEELRIAKPETKDESPSLYDKLNSPLTNIPSQSMLHSGLWTPFGNIPGEHPISKVVGSIADSLTSPINIATTALSGGLGLGIEAIQGARAANEAAQTIATLNKGKEAISAAAKTASALKNVSRITKGLNTVNKLNNVYSMGTGTSDLYDNYKKGDYAGMIGPAVQVGASALGFKQSGKVREALNVKPEKPLLKVGKSEAQYTNPNSTGIKEFESKGYKVEDRNGKIFISTAKPEPKVEAKVESRVAEPVIPKTERNIPKSELMLDKDDNIVELHGGFGLPGGLPGFPKSKPDLFKPLDPLAKKTISLLQKAAPIRGKIDANLGRKRVADVAAMEAVKETGDKGFFIMKSKMKGENKTLSFSPIRDQFAQEEIDRAKDLIRSSTLTTYGKVHAGDAFDDLLDGIVPKRSHLKELDTVFGENFGKNVIHMHGGLLSTPIENIKELGNNIKSLRAGGDLSYPLKQSRGLILTPQYWKSMGRMFQSTLDEDAAHQILKDIHKAPEFDTLKKLGVSFPSSEEYLQGDFVNNIPGFRHTKNGIDVFQTKLRFDTAKGMYEYINKLGLKGRDHEKILQDMVTFVNNVTGRGEFTGKVKELNRNIPALNQLFFSPRYQLSTAHMLNPWNMIDPSKHKYIRTQYAKAFAARLALGYTAIQAVKSKYGGTVEKDPRSADWMKLKVGNTRFDPWGGDQQLLVFLKRMQSNQMKSASGKIINLGEKFGSMDTDDVGLNFLRGKASPLVGAAADIGFRKNVVGEPTTGPSVLKSLSLPMFAETIKEVQENDPELVTPALLSFFGLNVQSYKPKKKSKVKVPQKNYLDWLKIR